jgi:hypothetical protein
MTVKMHRVVLYVKELNNEYSHSELKTLLEGNRHPEYVKVGEIKTTDIGEWHDKHPLNFSGANHEEYFEGDKYDAYKIEEACWGLVNDFFKDEAKTKLWMETKNPLLGEISPIQMIQLGRQEKLLSFINSSLDGNRP